AGARASARHACAGARSHVSAEILQFYVTHLLDSRGTGRGLVLTCERQPMRFRCGPCRIDYEPSETDWRCPRCGRIGELLEAGDEVFLESLEIECAPQPNT
ncbi:hydrogenase/urease maturation nickel metallochaperone HypA, partial [Rhodothermus marinus]|uniref:hydrogenase/urease maturation nickel metallochaperone HypA n=1 Tax=Rhodothermus marinus TaxID=29549 RepID=UPI0006CF6826